VWLTLTLSSSCSLWNTGDERHPCGNISGKILRVFPTQSYLFQIFIHSVSISLLWSASSLLFHIQEPVLQIVLLVLWLVSECKTRVMQTWHRLSLVTVSCNAFKFVLSISSSSVTYDMPKCCVCEKWTLLYAGDNPNNIHCFRSRQELLHVTLYVVLSTTLCSLWLCTLLTLSQLKLHKFTTAPDTCDCTANNWSKNSDKRLHRLHALVSPQRENFEAAHWPWCAVPCRQVCSPMMLLTLSNV